MSQPQTHFSNKQTYPRKGYLALLMQAQVILTAFSEGAKQQENEDDPTGTIFMNFQKVIQKFFS